MEAQKHLATLSEGKKDEQEDKAVKENTEATEKNTEATEAPAKESKEDKNESDESSDEKNVSEGTPAKSKDSGKAGVPVHLTPKMGYPATAVPELIRLRETERAIRNRIRKAPNAKPVADVRAYFNLFVEHCEEVIAAAEAAAAEKESKKGK